MGQFGQRRPARRGWRGHRIHVQYVFWFILEELDGVDDAQRDIDLNVTMGELPLIAAPPPPVECPTIDEELRRRVRLAQIDVTERALRGELDDE
jgi:hypothetical protein